MGMNTEAQASGLDTVKLAAAGLLLGGAVVAFYWFSDQPLLMRVLALLGVAAVSVLLASQTAVGRSVWGFMGNTRTEVRKVVWPTHQETVQTALMVIVVVIIISLFLAGVDWLLGALVRSLLGGG